MVRRAIRRAHVAAVRRRWRLPAVLVMGVLLLLRSMVVGASAAVVALAPAPMVTPRLPTLARVPPMSLS